MPLSDDSMLAHVWYCYIFIISYHNNIIMVCRCQWLIVWHTIYTCICQYLFIAFELLCSLWNVSAKNVYYVYDSFNMFMCIYIELDGWRWWPWSDHPRHRDIWCVADGKKYAVGESMPSDRTCETGWWVTKENLWDDWCSMQFVWHDEWNILTFCYIDYMSLSLQDFW